jgi:hypothetical protein
MIVQPDFLDHWKTRRLVEITNDESAPLAVLRLWAYCQTSRRWEFPDMTPAQLAAICRWASRKPACHIALVKVRFVDRLKKGFAAHDWEVVNAQLIQKWNCGRKGGRPAKPKTESEPAETGRLQPETRTQTDQTRQARIDQNYTRNVKLVNNTPEKPLTKLTTNSASMQRIARDITGNIHGWSYDNCKVKPEKIVSTSLETVLQPYAGRLDEKTIHECWQEAVTRAHSASVDQLAENPAGYCVACFREQLERAASRPTKT